MAKAKNEHEFTVLRVLNSTLPKLRKLHARAVDTSGGKQLSMYEVLDELIEKALSEKSIAE